VNKWSEKTDIPNKLILSWIGVANGKFHSWKDRYGKANEHNGKVPRDFWLENWERQAILDFHSANPMNGYRRLCFMMLDANVVAVSPSTVRNVLKRAGLLDRKSWSPSKKGTGFVQPIGAHEHWHIDVTYINISGTFFYLTTILDGYSRYIVHWELKASMTEHDIELILERAREAFPGVSPRIISDNGPQFVAKDFKEYVRLCGMTHVRTSPYYPQSNGKVESWHKSLKVECIRPKAPANLQEAQDTLVQFIYGYNHSRLHSAIGYITPADKLAGKETAIFALRDERLEKARDLRKARRHRANSSLSELQPEASPLSPFANNETKAQSAEAVNVSVANEPCKGNLYSFEHCAQLHHAKGEACPNNLEVESPIPA
jgi:transposase InsO family protein